MSHLGGATTGSQRHIYDDLDRLTEACYQATTCSGGADPFIRWTYDEVGNRLSEERPAGTTSYSYNSADQLTQRSGLGGTVAYTYDANGNQLSEGAKSFAYTLQNRAKSISSGGSTTSYFYDGDGKRLRRVDSSSTVKYLWDRNAGAPRRNAFCRSRSWAATAVAADSWIDAALRELPRLRATLDQRS